jgi:hypothetical protein
LREGFYYWSPPGTPHYPGFHLLGSKQWTTDERLDAGIMGEWEGKATYYDGRPPARLPAAVRVGSAECIERGFPGPNFPEANHSAHCDQILPAACYGAIETVFAVTNVLDCLFAFKSARIIELAYTDLAAAAAAAAELLGAAAVVTPFAQPNAEIPAGIVATIEDSCILWLTGTTTYQQLALQAFYFGFGMRDQGVYSTTDLYERVALAILAIVSQAGGNGATRFVLVGHSYGGALAQIIAARLLLANPARPVEVLTLGAPMVGDDRLLAILDGAFVKHYVAQDDPVPHMPPASIILAAVLPIAAALVAANWSRFERPGDRTVITNDGKFTALTPEVYPDETVLILASLVAQSQAAPQFLAHSSNGYRVALCRACACVPKPCEPPGAVGLEFVAVIENLRYTKFGVESRFDIAVNMLADPNGLSWSYGDVSGPKLLLSAVLSAAGGYQSFTLFAYESDAGVITARFTWEFTGVETLEGIDTDALPTIESFDPSAVVHSVARLVLVPSTAVFPPINGNAPPPDPFPIFNGNLP